jgi:hypothetical protein
LVSAATAALGIAAASFGGDGEDEGGDGGAKDTAESPTALPERTKKIIKPARHPRNINPRKGTNRARNIDPRKDTNRARMVFSSTANSHHDLHQFLYQFYFS